MNWRNLLYFSKGERKALVVLLCLITTAGILMILTDNNKSEEIASSGALYIVHPEKAPTPIPIDTTKSSLSAPPQAKTVITNQNNKKPPKRNTYSSPPKTEKYPAGTIVELNTADTTILKKVPGIGSTFARRIVKYRDLLGGFYTVSQLREVYGIDDERYQSLEKWFHADPAFIARLPINYLPSDSLAKHPYLSYQQARCIYRLRKQKGKLSGWENLHLMEEFSDIDKERLKSYFAF